jgi:hypothetical protein
MALCMDADHALNASLSGVDGTERLMLEKWKSI